MSDSERSREEVEPSERRLDFQVVVAGARQIHACLRAMILPVRCLLRWCVALTERQMLA